MLNLLLFRFYLVCLLRTTIESSEAEDDPLIKNSMSNHFNPSFVSMWKKTKNYAAWVRNKETVRYLKAQVPPGHPCSVSGYSVADVKLHWNNTITNTESGKRVTQVVSNTSKVKFDVL